jgi:hypothetical protein
MGEWKTSKSNAGARLVLLWAKSKTMLFHLRNALSGMSRIGSSRRRGVFRPTQRASNGGGTVMDADQGKESLFSPASRSEQSSQPLRLLPGCFPFHTPFLPVVINSPKIKGAIDKPPEDPA